MNRAATRSTTRFVAIVAIGCASGCGSAITTSNPAAVELSGPWITRTANHVSLSVPSDWNIGQPWLSASSFSDLVGSFSNQTLSAPCVTRLNSVSCGAPLKELRAGGMLVEVYESGFPQWNLSSVPGTPTFVSGLPAHVNVQLGAHDSCTGLGADQTRTEVIADSVPDNYVQIVICSRGPDAGQDAVASRILASVRVAVGT